MLRAASAHPFALHWGGSSTATMLWPLLLCCLLGLAQAAAGSKQQAPRGGGAHTNNWAVLVSTSRSWRNYRHSANLLGVYRTVKRLGIPDSNIIMMMADDHACNPRNRWKASLYNREDHALNVYGDDVEVDYRGYEVTVDNFLRVLTGRHDPAVPKSKRLLSDRGSNILVYMTGHGGDDFLKFQDTTELLGQDLADALDQMAEKGRYNGVLLMVDTCEAHSLVTKINAPRVITLASSLKGESAYSQGNDYELGQPVMDRFTNLLLEFAESKNLSSRATLEDFIDTCTYENMHSHYGHRMLPGFGRQLSEIRFTEFFGSVPSARLQDQAYPVARRPMASSVGEQAGGGASSVGEQQEQCPAGQPLCGGPAWGLGGGASSGGKSEARPDYGTAAAVAATAAAVVVLSRLSRAWGTDKAAAL